MAVQIKEKQPSDVETEQLATGCEAIAEAIRLADVDVMAAYPIRPYDGVMQAAAKLIANGKMDVEYIVADGEHSQFEIVKHACAVSAQQRSQPRSRTASASLCSQPNAPGSSSARFPQMATTGRRRPAVTAMASIA